MSAIIQLIVTLLPLILRLFGIAAGATGVFMATTGYTRLSMADPTMALTATPMLQAVGWNGVGGGVLGWFLFALANGLKDRTQGNDSRTSSEFGDALGELISYLSAHPELIKIVLRLFGFIKGDPEKAGQVMSMLAGVEKASGGRLVVPAD